MSEESDIHDCFVLKVFGKHHMLFKTKHRDEEYLKNVAEGMLKQEETEYTHFEIIHSDQEHANDELTHYEYPFCPVRD